MTKQLNGYVSNDPPDDTQYMSEATSLQSAPDYNPFNNFNTAVYMRAMPKASNIVFNAYENIQNALKNPYASSVAENPFKGANPLELTPEGLAFMAAPYVLHGLYPMTQFAPPEPRQDQFGNDYNGSWK